ncbi:MAG TPA: DUF3298 domain-containing protein [Patescibacteria group bacterium]|nr:DUF3298 domain-containing protein [Patescibacteria group bacterium]
MQDNSLNQLKKEYMNTPIPSELDFIVKKAFRENKINVSTNNKSLTKLIKIAASIAAAIAVLTIGINTSPAFAEALSKVPVVSSIVKVLTFKEFKVNENNFQANIKVPAIEGLENKELQNSLNDKYLKQNKRLYEEFMKDTEELKALGGGHMGIDAGYQIKTDNDKLLSIGRYVVNTAGSSSTTFQYDTIDKQKQILITLSSLFMDDSYIEIISKNIKEQMLQQINTDEGKIYWVEGGNSDGIPDSEFFKSIDTEQSFYINNAGKLVISFNKYEVAPGYMGTPEFEIPTEAIADILVGNEYIK